MLVLLFTLLIAGNTYLFWTLFVNPAAQGLSDANVRAGIPLQVRAALALEQLGVGKSAVRSVLEGAFETIDAAYAPYEARLYRAILESAFGIGEPAKTLAALPDLPSETLTPTARRWHAVRWQQAFTEPLTPQQVPKWLTSLPDAPSAFAGKLLELALYQRAGDTAQVLRLRQSLQQGAIAAFTTLGAVCGAFCFVGLLGVLALAWYFSARPVVPARPAPNESPYVYDPLLWALVIFLLVMLNAPILNQILSEWRVDGSNALYLLAVLLPLMYLASLRGQPSPLGQIRWFSGRWWKQIGVALMGYAAYLPLLLLLLVPFFLVAPALPGEQTNPIGERATDALTALQWLWTFAQAAVLAPIVEEFVFRGALFKVLWQRTGRPWLSAFVSGYLFAVIHPQFLGGVLPLTLHGMILALVYAHTRSLLPCILIHAIHNGLLTLMLWSVAM
ncbi:MAG: CPBP family intramembrane metalloprotease [Fimbriimonadales bacterium]|nr:CPBP family intramembrane metalloprotease [Fimbriimonadales bacterium]